VRQAVCPVAGATQAKLQIHAPWASARSTCATGDLFKKSRIAGNMMSLSCSFKQCEVYIKINLFKTKDIKIN
jgi:hypothetical protein